jgi:hypothetical protein
LATNLLYNDHMKILKPLSIAFALAAGSCLPAGTVLTTGSWDGAGKNLNNYFTTWGVGLDVNTGQMAGDEYWQGLLASGDNAVMLLEVAGHAPLNTFGIFQEGQAGITYTQIFAGGDSSTVNNTKSLSIPGGQFGFYLEFQGTYFYSVASKNAGGYDQLVTYQGPFGGVTTVGGQLWNQNSYLLAWEDLPYANSDKDYNDMVLMIRVQDRPDDRKVPDNGSTALLIGFGLLTLVGMRRKLL